MTAAILLILGAAGLLYAGQSAAFTKPMQRGTDMAAWNLPAAAHAYLPALNEAERRHGLPSGLLVAVAWQESRFRDDIITGKTQSPAGAVGLMQIIPRWHPDVNPYDPWASIDYAARYLAALRRSFGDWLLAVAAYNWGQGNLSRQGIAAAPRETVNYVNSIAGRMGWPVQQAWAEAWQARGLA